MKELNVVKLFSSFFISNNFYERKIDNINLIITCSYIKSINMYYKV